MKVAGVDEAGRGPVIGPMYVAGVMVEENKLKLIKELGVRDSKLISPKRRVYLAEKIKKIADVYLVEVKAKEIDELRKVMTMNDIEVVSFTNVLLQLRPDMAYLDAADVKAYRFSQNILKKYKYPIKIISEHNADKNYPIVSAASIIAKVNRDKKICELESVIGKKIGSGYPSDQYTRAFLEELIREGKMPDYVRTSWKTVEKIKKREKWKSLI